MNAPSYRHGRESLLLGEKSASSWRITVSSASPAVGTGDYEIRLESLSDAGPLRLAAEEASSEAARLRRRGTTELEETNYDARAIRDAAVSPTSALGPEINPQRAKELELTSKPYTLVISLLVLGGCNSFEQIALPTIDGGEVHGNDFGSGSHGVVLAHGGRFTKESWREQIPAFRRAGLRVLAIDFRGRGKSRGRPGSDDPYDGVHYDVLAAVRYLRANGASTVSVVGASFGGWAAAEAMLASEPGEIDRLVLLASAGPSEPERLTGRKLFIVTRDDFRGEGQLRLPEIRDHYERAPEPKELVILEGSAHAQFVFDTDQGERLLSEILRFLQEP